MCTLVTLELDMAHHLDTEIVMALATLPSLRQLSMTGHRCLFEQMPLLTGLAQANGITSLRLRCYPHRQDWLEPWTRWPIRTRIPLKLERLELGKATSILSEMFQIQDIRWPRRVIQDPTQPVIIVAFADASDKALAAAIYAWQKIGTHITSHLVFAIGKNAIRGSKAKRPVNTTPRLELNALLMATRAAVYVRDNLGVNVTHIHLFGDAAIPLCQIASQRPQEPYVQRRVDEINDANVTLHHIPGEHNPADMPSRGARVDELGDLWRYGPTLIRTTPPNDWPCLDTQFFTTHSPGPTIQLLHNSTPADDELTAPADINPSDFSSFPQLITVTGWVLRACRRFRRQTTPTVNFVSVTERKEALHRWVQYEQAVAFHDTIRRLRRQQRDQMARDLDLKLDDNGILVLGGRLAYSPLSAAAKNPILLPRGRHFSRLIILAFHEYVGHGLVRLRLNMCRQEFWIPQGRAETSKILRSCTKCAIVKGTCIPAPKMGPLPAVRLHPSHAWDNIGIDHTAAITIEIQAHDTVRIKAYVLIITCMWSRAVSLEVCLGLAEIDTLRALQRHISRRGRPIGVYSDRARGFIKAAKSLSTEGIQWHFSVPTAAWTGGTWESIVRIVKRVLRMTMWWRTVQLSDFLTEVAHAEHIANVRPLTPVTGAIFEKEEAILTPTAFIAPSCRLQAPLFSLSTVPAVCRANIPVSSGWMPARMQFDSSVKASPAPRSSEVSWISAFIPLELVSWTYSSSTRLFCRITRMASYRPSTH